MGARIGKQVIGDSSYGLIAYLCEDCCIDCRLLGLGDCGAAIEDCRGLCSADFNMHAPTSCSLMRRTLINQLVGLAHNGSNLIVLHTRQCMFVACSRVSTSG